MSFSIIIALFECKMVIVNEINLLQVIDLIELIIKSRFIIYF